MKRISLLLSDLTSFLLYKLHACSVLGNSFTEGMLMCRELPPTIVALAPQRGFQRGPSNND